MFDHVKTFKTTTPFLLADAKKTLKPYIGRFMGLGI
jgi:hypothetical protein